MDDEWQLQQTTNDNGWQLQPMEMLMDSDCDNDEQRLRQRCKTIHVCELYDDGVQKINFLIFFYFMFFFSLFSFSSSSRAATRATHYMTTSSKTHKSAQPRC